MTYAVSDKTLELLANLSKLNLTEEEKKLFLKQLEEIVAYISKIKELDTKNTKPLYHSTELKNVFNENAGRKASSKRSLSQKEALANAKQKKDGYFVVPKILDKNA